MNTRERPASEVVKDVRDRLEGLNSNSGTNLPKTTLDLIERGETDKMEGARALLSPASFRIGHELHSSLLRSLSITEKKLEEFQEKREKKGDKLSEKEKSWGMLMESEVNRKRSLIEKIEDHLWDRPKKVSPELVAALSEELESQARMKEAYERKVFEGKGRIENGKKILSAQIEKLEALGNSPVREYLAPDGKTWLVRSSELKEKRSFEDKELERVVL